MKMGLLDKPDEFTNPMAIVTSDLPQSDESTTTRATALAFQEQNEVLTIFLNS